MIDHWLLEVALTCTCVASRIPDGIILIKVSFIVSEVWMMIIRTASNDEDEGYLDSEHYMQSDLVIFPLRLNLKINLVG